MHASPALASLAERCSDGKDGFHCRPHDAGVRLELWGRLPDAWAANLAMHASALGLRIVTGDAARMEPRVWAARFQLASIDEAPVAPHDYLQMARRAPRAVPPLPEPAVSLTVRPSETLEGHYYAQVRGRDSLGLLATLLRRFAAYGLAPRHFSLRTVFAEVDDWFWLEPAVQDARSSSSRATLGAVESEPAG